MLEGSQGSWVAEIHERAAKSLNGACQKVAEINYRTYQGVAEGLHGTPAEYLDGKCQRVDEILYRTNYSILKVLTERVRG